MESDERADRWKDRQADGRGRVTLPVLFYLLFLPRLLLLREDVLLPHPDLKTLLQAAPLAEPPIRDVHLALLVVRTFEVILKQHESFLII